MYMRTNWSAWLLLVFSVPCSAQLLPSKVDSIANSYDLAGGSVVVFCNSGATTAHHFGKADISRNLPVTDSTKFRIASISKMVTALAILQLVAQGQLSLDAPIGQTLGYPVVNPSYPTTPITPRMLLSHTSSIIDGNGYDAFLSATATANPIPNLSAILTPGGAYYDAAQFNNVSPGTYFNYANINYVILGTMVEKASNLRFDVYCRQYIFQPLGIDASFNVTDLADINQVAVIYRKVSNVWTAQIDDYGGVPPVFQNLGGYVPGTNGGRFGPQGGLRISARDLAILLRCLHNPAACANAILPATWRDSMRSAQWTYNGSNGNTAYGLFRSWGLGMHRLTGSLGNDIALPGSALMLGHAGEAYGLVSDAYYDTARKVGFVFVTNGAGTGYATNSNSAFYTVEQAIFQAIEQYGNLASCIASNGVAIQARENTLALYPNPAGDAAAITVQASAFPCWVSIYRSDGLLARRQWLRHREERVDVADLPAGLYLIRAGGRQGLFVR